jgi:hypothetical protein
VRYVSMKICGRMTSYTEVSQKWFAQETYLGMIPAPVLYKEFSADRWYTEHHGHPTDTLGPS